MSDNSSFLKGILESNTMEEKAEIRVSVGDAHLDCISHPIARVLFFNGSEKLVKYEDLKEIIEMFCMSKDDVDEFFLTRVLRFVFCPMCGSLIRWDVIEKEILEDLK